MDWGSIGAFCYAKCTDSYLFLSGDFPTENLESKILPEEKIWLKSNSLEKTDTQYENEDENEDEDEKDNSKKDVYVLPDHIRDKEPTDEDIAKANKKFKL